MKRHMIVLSFLLAVSVSAVGFASVCIGNTQDDVTFTQQTVSGDPSAAKGLQATVYTQLDDRLFWTSRYDLTDNSTETDFRYGSSSTESPGEAYRGVEFTKAIWSDYFYDKNGEPLGYAKAIEELLQEIPANETKLVWYRIQEHFTYYPICWTTLQIDLPVQDPYTLRSSLQEVADAFHSYFRIPVLDEAYTLKCSKNDGGYSVSRNENEPPSGDSFDFLCINAVTDSACYFTFSTRSAGNVTVDTSQIPGGYGIFCLPYSADASKVEAAKLSTVYPLDPSVQVISLAVTKDQKHLLLTTLEDDICLLRIIEIASMTEATSIRLCNWDKDLPPQTELTCQDDFILCAVSGSSVSLISASHDGTFSLDLTADVTHSAEDWGSGTVGYAYNGEKLAVIYPNTLEYTDFTLEGCGFCICVYDRSGLLYNGKYFSSLDVADNRKLFEPWILCGLDEDSPQLTMDWTS